MASLLGRPAADPVEPRAVALAEHPVDEPVVARQVVLGEEPDLERRLRDARQARLLRRPGLLVEVAAQAVGDEVVGEPLLGDLEVAVQQPAGLGLQLVEQAAVECRDLDRGQRVVGHETPGRTSGTRSLSRLRNVRARASVQGCSHGAIGSRVPRMLGRCRSTASPDPSPASTGRSSLRRSTGGWTPGPRRPTALAAVAHGGTQVADFDPDELFDYRSRRPTLEIRDGRLSSLAWPEVTLTHVRHGERDLLVLTGAEPDDRWHRFGADVSSCSVSWTSGGG